MTKINQNFLNNNGLILPSPVKGKTRKTTAQLAALFAIKAADTYIQQCKDGESNKLNYYLKFVQKLLAQKVKEIKEKAKDGKWEITFGQDDIYSLEGGKAKIAEGDALEKIAATDIFVGSLVEIFWNEHGSDSNNLKYFIDWIPKFTAKL